ncbi:MAG: DUF3833 domain-containing protein [Pseudohongiellaceae bacterium]
MNRRLLLQGLTTQLSASLFLRSAGIAAGSAGFLSLTGCASPQVSDYASETPHLDLRTYFDGTVDAWGIFTDRSGQVVKRFTVVMDCKWQGDEGVLDEDFSYSDGTKQRRIWRLKALANGQYEGRADDVVGVASGEVQGNALRWRYTLALPVGGSIWHVQFDDWMYLIDDRVMINKAAMSKFGLFLGEVTLSFTRRVPLVAALTT